MDEWMLNDLLECSVCLERLDTSSKVLPCQHTFCKKCLEEIVESHKELRCPECRVLVDIGIEELPPNVLLMRILEGMKNAPKKRSSGVSRGHGTSSAPVHQHSVLHHQAQLAHQQQQQQSHHHHSSPAHPPASKPSHEHSSSPKQAILPGQPCARALYSYTSPESGDLTFKKGDLILLKKKIDANWFHGECSGNRGVFPSVYVEVLTPLPSPLPQCKALYDFRMTTDEEEGCLTFSKGEVINVIRRVDENWAEGKLGDRIGIFPLAFVELNQVARALMKLSTNSQPGPSRVAPPTPTSEETTPLIPIVEHHAAATAAQPATAAAATTQAPAAVAPRVLHRLGNSASSSSQTPSSSTTPNSSSTSCSSPSSTAPSSPASPPPQQQGDHPPLPHPRGTSSTSPLAQAPQQQQHREKRHSLNLLHAANPANIHRLSGEIPQHMDLAGATAAEHPTLAAQPAGGRNHRHRRSVSDQPAAQSGATASTTSGSSTAYAAASALPALYIAMYPYKPQKADELELKKGALYLVTEKCQDGWFKGTAQGSHKSGVFPGNYVALAKSQSHGTASASAGGGSRGGGGGVPRSNGHGSSWNKPFNGGSSGAQQGRQSKGSGSHGNSSERPYMDLARSMLAAAQAAMHTVTTSQATASPVVSKPSVSTSGHLLSTPPELPPRAASPNSASAAAPSISTSWHAQPASAASPSVGAELSPATPLGRSQSHSMVSTSVTPPPNVTVLVPASQPRAAGDKTKEKKSSSSGLIRRLTTMKKCKSPPPTTYSMDNPVFEDGTCGIVSTESTAAIQPLHARSGSCPSQLLQQVPCAESSTVLCESATPASRQHLHTPQMSGTAAAAATHSAGSQRIKHKERVNLIMANPAVTFGSGGARPSPLSVGTSSSESGASPALTANHRKSSSLDASSTDMGKKTRQLFPVVKERFRCIVPYPPNSEYELALQVGDVIHVHKKRDDGWYKGTQERTGRTGLFPASFVEAL